MVGEITPHLRHTPGLDIIVVVWYVELPKCFCDHEKWVLRATQVEFEDEKIWRALW